MVAKVKKAKEIIVHTEPRGKRLYFECVNGIRISIHASNGLLAAKQLLQWVKL